MRKKILIFAVMVTVVIIALATTSFVQAKNTGPNITSGIWYTTDMEVTTTWYIGPPPSENVAIRPFSYKLENNKQILNVRENPSKISVYHLLPGLGDNVYVDTGEVFEQVRPVTGVVTKYVSNRKDFDPDDDIPITSNLVVFNEDGIKWYGNYLLYELVCIEEPNSRFGYDHIGEMEWYGESTSLGKPTP